MLVLLAWQSHLISEKVLNTSTCTVCTCLLSGTGILGVHGWGGYKYRSKFPSCYGAHVYDDLYHIKVAGATIGLVRGVGSYFRLVRQNLAATLE